MATLSIDDALVDCIAALSPVEVEGRKRFDDGLQYMVLQAQMRSGTPEPQTGALARAYLIDGALLRDAGCWPEGGIDGEWRASVIAVDVRDLAAINERLGIEAGERMLRTVADGLRSFSPGTPVVRLHGDAFASIFLPEEESAPVPRFDEETVGRVRQELTALAEERVGGLEEAGLSPTFTIGIVELAVERPFHWRVLGPLVWAEAERAQTVARNGGSTIQQRRITLDGHVPCKQDG